MVRKHRGKKSSGLWKIALVLLVVMVCGCGLFSLKEKKETAEQGTTTPAQEVAVETTENKPQVKQGEKTQLKAKDAKKKSGAKAQTKAKKVKQAKKAKKAKQAPQQQAKAAGGAKPKLAIIVDDCGYHNDALRKLVSLPVTLNFAVLPNLPGTKEAIELVRSSKRTLLLHLPMEPMSGSSAGDSNMLKVEMTEAEIKALTQKLIAAVPGAQGVNNHMGSRLTSEKNKIHAALEVIKSKGLFFVDSRTIASSVAYPEAKAMGIPTTHNQLFIDHENDTQYVKSMIREAVERARKRGSFVAICHARPHTAAAWQEIHGEVVQAVELVPVTRMLE